jgi:hypothetical protein
MSHDAHGFLCVASSFDFPAKFVELPFLDPSKTCFFAQCQSQLTGLIRFKRLFQKQKPVAVAQLLQDIFPGVIAECRANHNVQSRIDFPEFFCRFHAIHPRGHAHINESERVGCS